MSASSDIACRAAPALSGGTVEVTACQLKSTHGRNHQRGGTEGSRGRAVGLAFQGVTRFVVGTNRRTDQLRWSETGPRAGGGAGMRTARRSPLPQPRDDGRLVS